MNKKHQPPKLAHRFFQWYCHPDYLEDLEGDLVERFERRTSVKGLKAARWGFIKEVLQLFRPEIIKPPGGVQQLNHYGMFKNYFKITWRSLYRQKLYAFINIGGLAVGLACFILVSLYVRHELSYDQFYTHEGQIYRIFQRQAGNMFLGTEYFSVTPAGLATALKTEFPEVIHATTLEGQAALLGFEENHYYEKGLWADPEYFEVFSRSLLRGNAQTALEKPASIVLTQSLAQKIFGDRDPLGKDLDFQNDQSYTVTGVIKDLPNNSSIQFSFLTSIQSNAQYVREKQKKWNNNSYYTFLKLAPNADAGQLQNRLPALYQKYTGHDENYPFKDTYFLQPLADLHLTTNINFDIGLKGNPKYISLFSLVAVVVLLLACANYMNLAVARSITRAREVGLRKVIGAQRRQLVVQFIGESTLIAFLALSLALLLAYFLSPIFSHLLERPLALDMVENMDLVPWLLLLVVFVGVLSGSYPALVMSSLRPAQVFKGGIQGRFSGMKIQRALIIAQYAASIVLIISSMVIYQQFQFIQDKELGYEKEHVVTLRIRDKNVREHFEALKSEWLGNPKIMAVATSNGLPVNITSSTLINDAPGGSKEDDLAIYRMRVDYDFIDLYGMEILAGRNFSPSSSIDLDEERIINETAAKALGWTAQEAIGQQFDDDGTKTVIGVIKDFHMHSMHMAIQPLMFRIRKDYFNRISIKVKPGNLAETLQYVQASLKKYSPYPFEYKFLDQQFDQLYKAELRLGEMFGFFTALSILIASLGLFGLAAFTAGQRTKEIGIRKVLGSTVKGIVALLAKDFLKVVVIGFLVATPIAWYSMHRWLQDFAYRIELEWWMFAAAGVFAVVIAFITISSQSLKAALANPVDSLRNE